MKPTEIYGAWSRIGGGFTVEPAKAPVDLEGLVIHTARAVPSDARLFWVAASWLAVHHHLIHTRRLGRMLEGLDPFALATIGALCDIGLEISPSAGQLRSVAGRCRSLDQPRVLFDAVAANPVLAAVAREEALPVFERWGLLHYEVTEKTDAVRPIGWILTNCPEFRLRALLGANLDAEIMEMLLGQRAAVSDLSAELGVTYAAAHEAASRLVGRGWVRRVPSGRRKELVPSPGVARWLHAFPKGFDIDPRVA